jgi:hypothetical protein
MHPLQPERLHQPDDTLEAGAKIDRQRIELSFRLRIHKDERPSHRSLYLFCNTPFKSVAVRNPWCRGTMDPGSRKASLRELCLSGMTQWGRSA